jgi:hypothetical protein
MEIKEEITAIAQQLLVLFDPYIKNHHLVHISFVNFCLVPFIHYFYAVIVKA